MTVVALVLFAVYFVVGFVLRAWIQWRRTGDSGLRGLSSRAGAPEWWAGTLFVTATLAGALQPVTALAGLSPVGVLTHSVIQVTSGVVAATGIVATFLAQLQMGTSWRVGVDTSETTNLVTTGSFNLVRHPIFTATAVTGLGLAFMVPNFRRHHRRHLVS